MTTRTIPATILGAILLVATAAPGQADDAVREIAVHRIESEPLIAFATRFFYKRHPNAFNWSFARRYRSTENWSEIVRDHVYEAQADINGDGIPELFLIVDSPDWCEAGGCLGDIFRRVENSYELICETALPAPDAPATTILGEVENGYHRLATANDTILWNRKQAYDSGLLCSTESRDETGK